jgi:hypothetical protein
MSSQAFSFDEIPAPPTGPELMAAINEPLPPYLVRLVHLMDRIERREQPARSTPHSDGLPAFDPVVRSGPDAPP